MSKAKPGHQGGPSPVLTAALAGPEEYFHKSPGAKGKHPFAGAPAGDRHEANASEGPHMLATANTHHSPARSVGALCLPEDSIAREAEHQEEKCPRLGKC